MRSLHFYHVLCWMLFHTSTAQFHDSLIVSTVLNTCVGIGSDDATLQLFLCDGSDALTWDISTSGVFKSHRLQAKCLDSVKSDNADAIQVIPCAALGSETEEHQRWSFNEYGQIKDHANTGCLTVLGKGDILDMLVLRPCDGSNIQHFASSKDPPKLGKSLSSILADKTKNRVPARPVPPKAKHPLNLKTPKESIHQPEKNIGKNTIALLLESQPPGNGFLCPCFDPAKEHECKTAVRAGCIAGKLSSDACKLSIDKNDHNEVIADLLSLLKRGEICDALAKGQVSQVQPESDHFLCACLEDLTDVESALTCSSALAAGCVLGLLPRGDCDSMGIQEQTQTLSSVANSITPPSFHTLRSIQTHSNCRKTRSTLTPHHSCPEPPCVDEPKDVPQSTDTYLCTCLDDDTSQACAKAIAQACDANKIPSDDCKLNPGESRTTTMTRHVLHLIDHGANCPDTPTLRFTNSGCHCLNSWTAGDGTVLQFPSNCDDPHGEKGFPWCRTVQGENCPGVSGQVTWDRCDKPGRPVYSPGVSSGLSLDHFLCPCLDQRQPEGVCKAAVEGACALGLLSAGTCQAVYQGAAVSAPAVQRAIKAALEGGSRCPSAALARWHVSPRTSQTDGSQLCGDHGTATATGHCRCHSGFAGGECTRCAVGFFGYPACSKVRLCLPSCKHGSCDHHTGTCTCPVNFRGTDCSGCASGHAGERCVPTALLHQSVYHRHPLLVVTVGLVFCVGSWYLAWGVLVRERNLKASSHSDQVEGERFLPAPQEGISGDGPYMNSMKHTGMAI